MERFDDGDDAKYLAWVRNHYAGFVLNVLRSHAKSDMVIHTTDCFTIQGEPPRGATWTGSDYIKMCSESKTELERWAREHVGERPRRCGSCSP